MAIIAKSEGDFKQVEVGSHVARCFGILDLGTHHDEYQGKANIRHKIAVQFEFPTELVEEGDYAGQPYSLTKFYTLSLGEKANLRKDLENWRSKPFTEEECKGFDITKLLGVPCFISVVKNKKDKSEISGIIGLPKGIPCPPQVNPSRMFSLSEWDQEAFEKLPKGFRAMIEESDEYKVIKRLSSAMAPDASPDDVPPPCDDDSLPF